VPSRWGELIAVGCLALGCQVSTGSPPPQAGQGAPTGTTVATEGASVPPVQLAGGAMEGQVFASVARPGYCAGASFRPEGVQTCRTHDDCDAGRCVAELAPEAACADECGEPRRDCATDDDCADGACMPATDPCWCGEGTICIPACTEGSCPEAHRCAGGRCEPLSCADDGMQCPDGTRCDPSAAVIDPHGCAPILCNEEDGFECGPNQSCHPGAPGSGCVVRSCATDDDCDCGACVLGTCRQAPGVCVPGDATEP